MQDPHAMQAMQQMMQGMGGGVGGAVGSGMGGAVGGGMGGAVGGGMGGGMTEEQMVEEAIRMSLGAPPGSPPAGAATPAATAAATSSAPASASAAGGPRYLANKSEFDACLAEAGDKLVVVNFTASWCGPCQRISPAFVSMSQELPDVIFVKVDMDANGETGRACGVSTMPTYQFYRSGGKVAEFSGANEARIRSTIDEHRPAQG